MDVQRLVEALNHALAQELAASIQFFWHHVLSQGRASPVLRQAVKQLAIQHMRHAEVLAERINHFDAIPTAQPEEIRIAGGFLDMLRADLSLQQQLVASYRAYLDLCREEPATHHQLLHLLTEEEENLDVLQSWLDQ
jgi:bacterioferritin